MLLYCLCSSFLRCAHYVLVHMVTLRELRPALSLLSESADPQTRLSEAEVRQGLERLFQSVSEEHPGQVFTEAIDQTTRLLFKLYDRSESPLINVY